MKTLTHILTRSALFAVGLLAGLTSCDEEEPQLPPTITSLSIAEGEVGTSVTITGTNFGDQLGAITVTFNTTQATVTSATSTSIVTAVPAGATTGPVKVKVNTLEATGPAFTVLEPITVSASAFNSTVAENSPAASNIGDIAATTNRGSLTYTITSQSLAGALAISSAGRLMVGNPALLDFEVNPTLTATVAVANGTETATSNVTVMLENVEEVTIFDKSMTIEENPGASAAIGTIDCCWIGASPIFELVSQSVTSAVGINASNGQLFVDQTGPFDFETNPTITGVYRITSQSETKTASFSIEITDVVESDYSATVTEVAGTANVFGCQSGTTTSFSSPFFGHVMQAEGASAQILVADIGCGVREITAGNPATSTTKYVSPPVRENAEMILDAHPAADNSFIYATLQQYAEHMTRTEIIKIFPNGTIETFVNDLVTPTGLAVDASGYVYVAETDGRQIKRFAQNGTLQTTYGTGAIGGADGTYLNATFARTRDVQVDAQGTLYVADRYSVRKIDTFGNVTTIAGTNEAGDAEGPVTSARFNEIHSLGLLTNNNILVADHSNNKIKMITTNGTVVTLINASGRPQGIMVVNNTTFYFTVAGIPVLYKAQISYPGM